MFIMKIKKAEKRMTLKYLGVILFDLVIKQGKGGVKDVNFKLDIISLIGIIQLLLL